MRRNHHAEIGESVNFSNLDRAILDRKKACLVIGK